MYHLKGGIIGGEADDRSDRPLIRIYDARKHRINSSSSLLQEFRYEPPLIPSEVKNSVIKLRISSDANNLEQARNTYNRTIKHICTLETTIKQIQIVLESFYNIFNESFDFLSQQFSQWLKLAETVFNEIF